VVLSQILTEGLLQKPPSSTIRSADWFHCRDVSRHSLVVMHVVSKFLRIFLRAEKQKQACNCSAIRPSY